MHHDQADLVLALKGLSLSYRARPVLRGLDWTWQRGEHWAVLGPNGAGKSSLAAVLSGEQTHFAGRLERGSLLAEDGVAYVCFERGRRLCERDRKLDCSEFEGSATDVGTRVRDLLAAPDHEAQRFGELVALLDLEHLLDRGLRHISTGELRKALLASALLRRPGLLILDSPLDGLDRATQERLGAALNTIIDASPAVLVLSRSESEVPRACNRLMLLDDGRMRATGETTALLQDPQTAALLTAPTLHFQPPTASEATAGMGGIDVEAGSAGDSTALRDARDEDTPPPALDLHNVSVSFGDLCVFRDLTWRLGARQHCLIAGPNGCGKSTLLDLLTGDNHKAYGQAVALFGHRRGSGESVWDIKRQFGRVDARMQFAVSSGSRVMDVVLSGHFDSLGLRERPSDRQTARGRAWLAALGLAELAREEFHTLSFGLQRLTLLARAMVKDPRILLLDEATLSLDTGHRRLLLEAVDHVVATNRCQVLFVSHTPGEVPACINQQLRFEPQEGGSRVTVSSYP